MQCKFNICDYTVKQKIALAIHESSKDILDHLSNDKDEDVRYYVALNSNTSPQTLRILFEQFPAAVLRNRNCPAILKVFG
jgi:hypothetical protein